MSVTGPVTASFTAAPAVETGKSVQFTDTSSGNPFTFAWDFGDGSHLDRQEPAHVYTTAGTYTVSLTATNPPGPLSPGHADTVTGTITVYDRVDASFTANPSRGLAPLTVQFTDTSTGHPDHWNGTSATAPPRPSGTRYTRSKRRDVHGDADGQP